MNLIILPTAYPNIYNEHSSIFVQDQARALAKYEDMDICVVGAIPISFKDIWKKKLFKFGNFYKEINSVKSHLFLYPSIPKLRKFNELLRYMINNYLLRKFLKKNKVNIIHIHNSTVGKTALWLKREYNIPYVITEHSSSFARGRISKRIINDYFEIYKKSSKNIAVSKDFKVLLSDIYKLNFIYIPNVVDTNYFNLKNENNSKEFYFINIANVNKNKNQILLINAFSQSFNKVKNIKLKILGDGEEYTNLQNEIDRLQMNEQIKLFGFAKREQVLEELKSSDVFVLSSKYETFGVVLIEAMSCGLPVISTKCGGPESIIVNDKLGILVDNEDENKLSKAMIYLYKHKKHYNSNRIRNNVIKNFSEKAIITQLIDIYQKVLNEAN